MSFDSILLSLMAIRLYVLCFGGKNHRASSETEDAAGCMTIIFSQSLLAEHSFSATTRDSSGQEDTQDVHNPLVDLY